MPAISLERLNNCYLVTPTNCLFLKEKNREHPSSVQGASPAVPSVPWRRSPGVCQSSVTGELRTQAWGWRARGRGKATVSSQRLRSVRTAGRRACPAQTGAASGPARAATATGERARRVCHERFPRRGGVGRPSGEDLLRPHADAKGTFPCLGRCCGAVCRPLPGEGGTVSSRSRRCSALSFGGLGVGVSGTLKPRLHILDVF